MARATTLTINEHGSEARSWAVETEEAGTTSKFVEFTKHTGPFPPGDHVNVCDNRAQNTGGSGVVNIQFCELNADGSVKSCPCSKGKSKGSGGEWGLIYDSEAPDPYRCSIADEATGSCLVDMPDEPGAEVYYGIRTWGEDESKPSFPSPTAVAVAGAGGGIMEKPKALAAGAGIAGLVAGYFLSKR